MNITKMLSQYFKKKIQSFLLGLNTILIKVYKNAVKIKTERLKGCEKANIIVNIKRHQNFLDTKKYEDIIKTNQPQASAYRPVLKASVIHFELENINPAGIPIHIFLKLLVAKPAKAKDAKNK